MSPDFWRRSRDAVLTLGWLFALGRRSGAKYREPEPFPPGNQGFTDEDQPVATDSYEEVKAAVFSQPYYGKAWGGPERMLLPIYKQTLGSILRGLFPLGKRLFLQAAKRTVISRADLRWGPDRKGFRRLLHPMGVCLTGTWKITGAPAGTAYTGYFAKGAEGRIIGRYSNGGSKPWGGHYRSLSLIGKIYPPKRLAAAARGAGPLLHPGRSRLDINEQHSRGDHDQLPTGLSLEPPAKNLSS